MTHQNSLQWTKFAGDSASDSKGLPAPAPMEFARRRLVGEMLGLPLLLAAATLAGCAGPASEAGPMRDMARGSAAKRRNPRWGYRDHAR